LGFLGFLGFLKKPKNLGFLKPNSTALLLSHALVPVHCTSELGVGVIACVQNVS